MGRTTEDIEPFPGAQAPGEGLERRCQWYGCIEDGAYRAPTDRTLSDYYMFCLDHVRVYNAQWNYHEGMGTDEMEQEFRSAATWDRPTWKLGERHAPGRPWHSILDPFDVFKEAPNQNQDSQRTRQKFKNELTDALEALDLRSDVSVATLKERYKELVKQHHPDANGGSEDAENRMKVINSAYHVILSALSR